MIAETNEPLMIDEYNRKVHKGVSIAITTRISESNHYFILIKNGNNK